MPSFVPHALFTLAACAGLAAVSCAGGPARGVAAGGGAWAAEDYAQARGAGGGLADEIRALVEAGSPSALRQALGLVQQRGVAGTEYGRVMGSVALTLLDKVYGESYSGGLRVDFPQTHKYAKIIREAETGRYAAAPPTADYLELTLPFLAELDDPDSGAAAALPDLQNARRANPQGVLAAYFLGLLFERLPHAESAAREYARALAIAEDCYPASLGLARLLSAGGKQREAIELLAGLERRYPGNAAVKRQLAFVYTKEKLFEKAGVVIQQALAADPRDADMLLLNARYLIEKGQAIQAQLPLDMYIQDNRENAAYALLRARVAAEGFNNRENAAALLRPAMRAHPNDFEIRMYMIRLLLESAREDDNREGEEMLESMLKTWSSGGGGVPYELIELAMRDAVRRAAWEEAKKYRDQIPEEKRGSGDLLNAYEIEQGLGNNREALSYARRMRETYPDNEDGNIAYATALIDAGQKAEAGRIVNERIAQIGAGSFKSRYYFLRSRLQSVPDAAQADLRSALFENPRNLDAIVAMFELYDKKNDERRAAYYLKQAAALAPGHPAVKAYEKKYADKM